MPDVQTIRVVIPQNKVVKINVIELSGPGIIPLTPEPPHYFLAGPDAGVGSALPTFRPQVPADIAFAAILALPNVFTDVNTFPGLRVGTRNVTADYTMLVKDYDISADATAAPFTITLPQALGTGQMYAFKKTDPSANAIIVSAQGGDVIDGNPNVALVTQFDCFFLIDSDIGVWDRFQGLPGGTIPSDIARTTQDNIFTNVNSFRGLQIATLTVTANYTLTLLDYEVLADATAGSITIQLPPATGSGQEYHIKKIDTTDNIVTLQANGTDTIDGSISVNLATQYADAGVIDGASGYWDNTFGADQDLPDLDVARLSLPNVFLDVNTFPGLRVGTRVVSSDYALQVKDYEILADATAGPLTITLPPSSADGQMYRIKKIDSSPNAVLIQASGTDLIDSDSSIGILNQFQVVTLVDANTGFWDKGLFIPPFTLPADLARLDQPNVFTDLNTFTGIRLATKTVTTDYTLTTFDFELLVDATSGPITISLPPSSGIGQYYRIKKIDTTANVVTVAAAGSDLIDGSISINFSDQYADATLFDAAPGYWDNTGSAAAGGGGGADFGINGRVVDLNPIRGFSFEVYNGTSWIEQVRYTEPSGGPAPATPVGYWYRPEIQDLTALKAWPTVGNPLLSRLDCMYNPASNIVAFTILIIQSGAADGTDPGQVAPDDYDAGTNDVHWRQVS